MPGRRHCKDCGVIIPAGEKGHRRFWCGPCLSAKRKRANPSGPSHYRWTGAPGAPTKHGGYRRVTVAPGVRKPNHVAVWEAVHGPVPTGMHVHHRDRDKTNDAIDNLVLLTNSEHQVEHRAEARARALAQKRNGYKFA